MFDRVEDKTYQGFLHDIIRQSEGPDWEDDGLRLILADYLEDRGEEGHASFIRAQCRVAAIDREIAGLPRQDRCDHENDRVADGEGYLGCPECELKREKRSHRKRAELTYDGFWMWLMPRGALWEGAWPGTPEVHLLTSIGKAQIGYGNRHGPVWTMTVRRGFPESLELPGNAWAKWGREIRHSFPVREVKLDGAVPGRAGSFYFWALHAEMPLGPVGSEVSAAGLKQMRLNELAVHETAHVNEAGEATVIRVYFETAENALAALSAALLQEFPLLTFPGAAPLR